MWGHRVTGASTDSTRSQGGGQSPQAERTHSPMMILSLRNVNWDCGCPRNASKSSHWGSFMRRSMVPPLRHHRDTQVVRHDVCMAHLCEYFVADSDEAAAAAIGWVGGPQRPPKAKGLFRRSRVDPIPTVNTPGIEPVVMLSTLGNLLRGLTAYSEEIPDDGTIVDSREGGERLIYRISNSVVTALAESEEAAFPPIEP
jgi:hypothetical protein